MRQVTPGWRGLLVGGVGMAALYLGAEPLGRAFNDHHDFFGWGLNVVIWGSAIVGLVAGLVAGTARGFVGALCGWLVAGIAPALVDGQPAIAGIVLVFSFLYPIGAAIGAILGWAARRAGRTTASVVDATAPAPAPTENLVRDDTPH